MFYKIDVEGLDHLVVQGMKNYIKEFLPIMLIEYNLSNFILIYEFLKKNIIVIFMIFLKIN